MKEFADGKNDPSSLMKKSGVLSRPALKPINTDRDSLVGP